MSPSRRTSSSLIFSITSITCEQNRLIFARPSQAPKCQQNVRFRCNGNKPHGQSAEYTVRRSFPSQQSKPHGMLRNPVFQGDSQSTRGKVTRFQNALNDFENCHNPKTYETFVNQKGTKGAWISHLGAHVSTTGGFKLGIFRSGKGLCQPQQCLENDKGSASSTEKA